MPLAVHLYMCGKHVINDELTLKNMQIVRMNRTSERSTQVAIVFTVYFQHNYILAAYVVRDVNALPPEQLSLFMGYVVEYVKGAAHTALAWLKSVLSQSTLRNRWKNSRGIGLCSSRLAVRSCCSHLAGLCYARTSTRTPITLPLSLL
jgi:hypothetical protein